MLDSIIKELRRLRAKRSIELGRNMRKAIDDDVRKVFAMASNVVCVGPHLYRATFTVPPVEKRAT
jgi:hypothetical protein